MGCSSCGGVKKTSGVKITSNIVPQKKLSATEILKSFTIEKVSNEKPGKNNKKS